MLSQKAFTLVELLVVIVILAILGVVGTTLFNNVNKSATDARKKADILAISKAYESNYRPLSGYQPLSANQFVQGTIPVPGEGLDYFNDLVASGGFRVCSALNGHPQTVCSTPSETCFCKDSVQITYASSGLPAPSGGPSPSPAASVSLPSPSPSPDPEGITGMAIIGDSSSDEYRADDNRAGSTQYAATTLNWMELLERERGINFGPWSNSSRGEPRRRGFEYNFARSAARVHDVITTNQHTSVRDLVSSGAVSHVYIQIGANDAATSNGTYQDIYNGVISGAALIAKRDAMVADYITMMDTVKSGGNPKMIIATMPDVNLDSAMAATYPNATNRQRVTDFVNGVNDLLKPAAQARGVVVLDIKDYFMNELVPRLSGSYLMVGGVQINMQSYSDEPHHMIIADTVHPGTVANGLHAAHVAEMFNANYGTNIVPFTDQEILEYAGIAAPAPSPSPAGCVLSSASWSHTTTTDGNTVTLTVNGTGPCQGLPVSFEVWENDSIAEGVGDDAVSIQPAGANLNISGVATTTWVADWQDDCNGFCLPPEFYFNATVQGGNTIRSADPLLEVNPVPAPPQILGNNTVGTSLDTNTNCCIYGSKFTMGASSGTATSISAYVGGTHAAPSNQYGLAIYTDNAGSPANLVAGSTAGTLTANAWNTVPISATLNANTTYWIFYISNAGGNLNNVRYSTSTAGSGATKNYLGPWQATITGATLNTKRYSMYVTYTPN